MLCPKGVRLLPLRIFLLEPVHLTCSMFVKCARNEESINLQAFTSPRSLEGSRRFKWIIILSPNVITVQRDKCVSRVEFQRNLQAAHAHSGAKILVSLFLACVGISSGKVIPSKTFQLRLPIRLLSRSI